MTRYARNFGGNGPPCPRLWLQENSKKERTVLTNVQSSTDRNLARPPDTAELLMKSNMVSMGVGRGQGERPPWILKISAKSFFLVSSGRKQNSLEKSRGAPWKKSLRRP